MSNTLTNLIPTLYQAIDIVSREIVGFIPAVNVNARATSAAKGETILVPVTPPAVAYDITPGANPADNGDQVIGSTPIVITKSRYAPVRWTGEEVKGVENTGAYNAILANQMAQAMRVLVNEVEADIAACYVSAARAVGTAGTTPFGTSLTEAAIIRKALTDSGAPLTDLQLVVDTAAGASLRSLANLTHANENASDATLRRGTLLSLMGFAVHESAQVKNHTPGSITGDMAVNHANGYAKGTTSIAWDGATAASLKAGDILTFGTDTTKYIVAKNSTASPLTLNAPGLLNAVDNDAAVALGSSYAANMAFDRQAIQLVTRPPAMPKGGDAADGIELLTDPVSGITFQVALYREYRRVKFEIGLAWGVACVKPEHLCLLLG